MTSPESGSALFVGGWWAAAGAVTAAVVVASAGIAYQFPSLFWVLPALLLGAAALFTWTGGRHLRVHPLLPLLCVLVLAGIALQRSDGIQPAEVLFAAYYLPYLGLWYGSRILIYREPLVWQSRDWGIVLFLVTVQAQAVMGFAQGAQVSNIQSDWLAFSMMWFYFPIREMVSRYQVGHIVVLVGIVFIAFAALYRNLMVTQTTIAAASYAWEVARVRVTANELGMTSGALVCAALAVLSKTRRGFVIGGAAFALLTVGVILTQWRAYYVTLGIGILVLAAVSGKRGRRRVGVLILIGAVVGGALLFALLGDGVVLLFYGVLDRILSIGTATRVDESLLNRFVETEAAMNLIYQSPIVGYGLGSTFEFMDVIVNRTWVKHYAHNGYVSLWFKLGGIGLLGLLWFWGRTVWDGWCAVRHRMREQPFAAREALVAAWSMLIGLIPSFAVSAPFVTSDTALGFTLVAGLVAGLHDRLVGSPAKGAAYGATLTA